jgi:hypothetical protein
MDSVVPTTDAIIMPLAPPLRSPSYPYLTGFGAITPWKIFDIVEACIRAF